MVAPAPAPYAAADPMTEHAHPTPDDRPPVGGLLRAAPMIATVGVIVAIVGLVALARPVETPVQDCGTAIGFLLDGRVNVYANPAAPPEGLTAEEVTANNERPCRVRVAATARPGAILVAAGVAAAVIALVSEVTARILLRRRRHRAGLAAAA